MLNHQKSRIIKIIFHPSAFGVFINFILEIVVIQYFIFASNCMIDKFIIIVSDLRTFNYYSLRCMPLSFFDKNEIKIRY